MTSRGQTGAWALFPHRALSPHGDSKQPHGEKYAVLTPPASWRGSQGPRQHVPALSRGAKTRQSPGWTEGSRASREPRSPVTPSHQPSYKIAHRSFTFSRVPLPLLKKQNGHFVPNFPSWAGGTRATQTGGEKMSGSCSLRWAPGRARPGPGRPRAEMPRRSVSTNWIRVSSSVSD